MEGFTGIPWRNTGLPVKIGPVDARALAFILLFLFHIRLWTFLLCVFIIAVLSIVEYKGYTLPNALRTASSSLLGPKRESQSNKRKSDLNR